MQGAHVRVGRGMRHGGGERGANGGPATRRSSGPPMLERARSIACSAAASTAATP